MAQVRHKVKVKSIKLTSIITSILHEGLRKGWSPEIICGRLYLEEGVKLHHETVYQWIYKDKAAGGELYKHLCHASKPYRKRYGNRVGGASRLRPLTPPYKRSSHTAVPAKLLISHTILAKKTTSFL